MAAAVVAALRNAPDLRIVDVMDLIKDDPLQVSDDL